MKASICPYIQFKSDSRSAMEFYKNIFGGELTISTFKDMQPDMEGDQADLVMHAQLAVSESINIMASDTAEGMESYTGDQVSVSLFGDDTILLNQYWNGLVVDAKMVLVPMSKQMWGDEFGMLVDKFGVKWLVNVEAQK